MQRKRRIVFWTCNLALLGLILGLLLFWKDLVRAGIEFALQSKQAKTLGLKIVYGELNIHSFPLGVELTDFRANIEKGPLKELSVKSLNVDMGLVPAFSGKILIKKVVINHPLFVLQLGSGEKKTEKSENSVFDFSRLVNFEIQEVAIRDAQVDLRLPGEELKIVMEHGNGALSADKKKQQVAWDGAATLEGRGTSIPIQNIKLLASARDQNIQLDQLSFETARTKFMAKGLVYPKPELSAELQTELSDVQNVVTKLGYVGTKPSYEGNLGLRLNVTGTWDDPIYSSSGKLGNFKMDGDQLGNMFWDLSGNETVLKKANIQSDFFDANTILTAKDFAFRKGGKVHIESRHLSLDRILQWVHHEKEPQIVRSSLDIKLDGSANLASKQFLGNVQVTADQLTIDLEKKVRQFLPLRFKNILVKAEVALNKNTLKVSQGTVNVDGLQATHGFDFDLTGKRPSHGIWKGTITNAGEFFEPGYEVGGQGEVGGGLTVDGKDFFVDLPIRLQSLTWKGHETLTGSSSLEFRKGETKVTKTSFTSQAGARVIFDSTFFSEKSDKKSWIDGKWENLDLAWVSDLAGIAYPFLKGMKGKGSGAIKLQDFEQHLTGFIKLDSDRVTSLQFPDMAVHAGLTFTDQVAKLDGTTLTFLLEDRSKVTVSGAVGGTSYNGLTIHAKELNLSQFKPLSFIDPSVKLNSLYAQLNGPIDDPNVSGQIDIQTRSELLKTSLSGKFSTIEATTVIGAGLGTLRSQFDTADLFLEVDASFKSLNLSEIFSNAPVTLSGHLNFEGKADDLQSFSIIGNLDQATLWPGEAYQLVADVPMRVQMNHGILIFDHWRWHNDRDAITLRGNFDLGGELDAHAEGDLDLAVLPSLNSTFIRGEGRISLSLDISGALSEPKLSGWTRVNDGFLQLRSFPHAFEHINLEASIRDKNVWIEKLQTDFADGVLTADGRLTLGNNLATSSFDVRGFANNLYLRFPPWLPAQVNGPIGIRGPVNAPTLFGDLEIIKARYQDNWDWKSKVLQFRTPVKINSSSRSQAGNLKFDLRFVTRPGAFRLQNNLAEAKLDGDIRLTGSIQSIGLLGKIDIFEGTVKFLDQRFNIDSGQITFTDPNSVQMLMDLNASVRVQQTDIFLDIRTQRDEITAFLSSQPPKDETNIIALLALGVDSDQIGFSGGSSSGATSAVVPGVLSAPVQNRLEKGLKETRLIDSIQFVPSYSDQSRDTVLRMVLGKELFPRVQLLYSTDLFNIGLENTVKLQQNLRDNIYLQGSIRDNNGEQTNNEVDVGLDFEFRFDF